VDEIHEMLDSGLVEFYPHTMTHQILAQTSRENAKKEVTESKQWLEKLLKQFNNDMMKPENIKSNATESSGITNYQSPSNQKEFGTGQVFTSYPCDIFAYPSGNPGIDFGPEHEQLLREIGFTMAVSLRRASNEASPNLMNIERRMALNEPLPFFKLRIEGYYDSVNKNNNSKL